ncbi:MAG: tetratricopeptide repeat protein, partial [Planctomycetes bacterium]|nr:tetratricopeptide repeat protein [Planctomycetota bacterium]
KGELIFNWFNARRVLSKDDLAYFATDYHLLGVERKLLPSMAEAECKEFEQAYKKHRVASYLTAAKIDNGYADLQYRLGKCYYVMAEYDNAKDRYVRARDMDTLRFRADTRITQIIREVASDNPPQDLLLVDAVKGFEESSPHGIPGTELFHEHVHLNFHGNYLLAKMIFEQVERILPDRLVDGKRTRRPFLTETECARHLAWTDWDQHKVFDEVVNRYLKKAPFTNQLYHDERIKEMEQGMTDLKISLTSESLNQVAAQYRHALEQDSGDWMLRERYGMLLLNDLKDPASALEQYRFLATSLPHSYLGHYNLGTVLSKLGDFKGAVVQYDKALRIKPTYGNAHYKLALANQKLNKMDDAMTHYSEAVRWKPDLVPAYNNLAEIHMRRQAVDKAIEVCRNGLQYSPDSAILHCNLGVLLSKKHRRDEAIKEIQLAAKLDPESARIQSILRAMSRRSR